MPGFAIALEATGAFPTSRRIQSQAVEGSYAVHGNHVPNVSRNDVGSQEVYFFRLVQIITTAALGLIAAAAEGAASRLDLYPPQALARVHDKIVPFVVAMGLGHTKSQTRSLEYKGEFRQVAPGFRVHRSAYHGCDVRR